MDDDRNQGNKLAVANSPQAALALVSVRGVIRDLPALKDFLEAVRAQAVVLAPVAHLGALPALYRVQISAVMADPVPGNGDVYVDPSFCKGATGAPTKAFLLKIMAAAGIGMGDSRATWINNVATATVMLVGRGLDGQMRRVIGTKIIDLTDDAPGAFDGKGVRLTPSALGRARTHAPQMAETKAILRGLRAWFGMKQAYALKDFEKPWIIPALVLDLDAKNPEHLKYIVGMSVGATDALFGPSGAAPSAGLLPEADMPPVEAAPPDEGEDDTLAGGDGEEADIPAEPPAPAAPDGPPVNVCACRCGHQVEVSQAFANTTTERLGILLCARCVPGRSFDEATHASLKSLSFPKRPDWNVVANAIASARQEKAKAAATAKK